MKKSMLVLTAALMFGGLASAQTSATASAPQVPALTDVPAGHWAKDAIDRLVSRGILLGYPDGTFRGTQNLTRYEAAVIIARLLEQMAAGTAPVVAGDDLVALQNAVQELAADLAALGVRVSDLEENAVSKDDFSRLEARVEELAGNQGDAEAVAALQAQIDDLTARADEYDTLRADVDDNASSIAALNDLTVLLNQDILDLQDRVSAVEAAQADFVTRADFDNLSTRVTGIDTRVATLEKAPKFGVTGTINATYGRLLRTSGPTDFDVDRLTRQTFADGVFSSGVNCPNDTYSPSGNAVSCTDTNQTYGGYINFGVKASNLTTANGKVVVNNAGINFYVGNSYGLPDGAGVFVDDAYADGTISGQKFDVRYHSYRSSFKFNDYLFANDNANQGTTTPTLRRGVVANIEATQLPLAPKLTIVAGTAATTGLKDGNVGASAAAGTGSVPGFVGNYYGVRASVNPLNAGTLGLSFASNDGNRTAFGVDYDLGFGTKDADGNAPFTINGAYVASVKQTAGNVFGGGSFNSRDQAFFTDVKGNLGIVKLGANYRAVSPGFANGEAGMSVNDAPYFYGACGYKSSMPYCPNETGFGGAFSTKLGPIALDAYGDSYTDYLRDGEDDERYTSFGVAAGAKFFGLKAVGFFNRTTEDTEILEYNTTAFSPTTSYMDIATVPFMYTSTYGGVLSHDGKASDALIKNLNFTVADAYFYNTRINDLQVYGDYSGTIAGITIAPFARYHMLTTPGNEKVTFTSGGDVTSYNTFKYGVKVSTQPLTAVPLQPSLFGNFAQRRTTVTGNTNVTSETLAQAGLSLNQFFAPNLKASVGYAYYQGLNVGGSTAVGGSGSGVSATYSAAADRIYNNPNQYGNPFSGDNIGTNSASLNGVFAQMDWNGFAANYGVFRYNDLKDSTKSSVAQGFKVSYTFKF
ncbi:S-layer protein [Deinococcus cavernae]|uniref:S-layer protein n=1 Tax=Deinococcus cavernae TaxID=2320857 RepID=A0A418V7I7_9DEIO|nr:S-layer homology domain-containing protein [Deinococcus cavernae]RJF72062.1 S-layer protein [Deinococcus cavernae]